VAYLVMLFPYCRHVRSRMLKKAADKIPEPGPEPTPLISAPTSGALGGGAGLVGVTLAGTCLPVLSQAGPTRWRPWDGLDCGLCQHRDGYRTIQSLLTLRQGMDER